MRSNISQMELRIKSLNEEQHKAIKEGSGWESDNTVNTEVEGKVKCTSPSGQFSGQKVQTNGMRIELQNNWIRKEVNFIVCCAASSATARMVWRNILTLITMVIKHGESVVKRCCLQIWKLALPEANLCWMSFCRTRSRV